MRFFVLAAPSARVAISRASCGSMTSAPAQAAKRTFTSLPQLRPSIAATHAGSSSGSVFRSAAGPTTTTTSFYTPSTVSSAADPQILDLVPRGAITTNPGLAGGVMQVRCGPRPNLERSSRLVRKRRIGFLTRQRSRTGRKILERRRAKKRSTA